MKLLSVIVVLSMASTASLQAQGSLPIGTVTVTGLGQAVADGDLCLGPNGATSFGGIITYDDEEFKCVSGKTLTGKSLAGWVSTSSMAQSVDIKDEDFVFKTPIGPFGTIEVNDNNVKLLKLNEIEIVGCELKVENIEFEDLTMAENNTDRYGIVKINFNEMVCESGARKINAFAFAPVTSIKNTSSEKNMLLKVSEIAPIQDILFKN